MLERHLLSPHLPGPGVLSSVFRASNSLPRAHSNTGHLQLCSSEIACCTGGEPAADHPNWWKRSTHSQDWLRLTGPLTAFGGVPATNSSPTCAAKLWRLGPFSIRSNFNPNPPPAPPLPPLHRPPLYHHSSSSGRTSSRACVQYHYPMTHAYPYCSSVFINSVVLLECHRISLLPHR